MITQKEKEGIIAEYLATEISYRALGEKYGVDFRTLHQWVQNYLGKMRSRKKGTKAKPLPESQELLPTDVKKLQQELDIPTKESRVVFSLKQILNKLP